jgi:nitrate/nitrite-specific signal transduction histidine kinase
VQNADLFEQTRLRQRWLEATAEIRTELLAGASDKDALRLIAQRTLELVRADATAILLGPAADGSFTIAARRGQDEDVLDQRIPPGHPLLAEVVDGRAPVLTESVDEMLIDSAAREMYGSLLAVPLQTPDSVIGVLTALRLAGREPFHPTEVPLLTSFSEQATLALELGEKSRAQRKLDVFADRDRIARDLTPTEDDTGLRRKLLDTAAEAAAGSFVSPSVRISGPIDTVVPAGLATHAIAVVREAISNAVRHGHADSVTLTVEAGDDLLVDVLDDGVGIPADVGRSGLRNLEERARECGGRLSVRRVEPSGTRLTWCVPLTGGA